jgi:hypothetical protein
MKFKIFFILIIATGFILNGCTLTQYAMTIPKTPENLQAYRECQRTKAVAKGNDALADEEMYAKCLQTIVSSTTRIESNSVDTPSGCERIESLNYIMNVYFFCKP